MASGGAAEDVEDLDDLDDLDDVGGAPLTAAGGAAAPAPRPSRVPAWARGRAAVVVLVVVAAALGALAGGAHREVRDEQQSLEQALTVGTAFLAGYDLRSGQLRADVRLALANHGDLPVAVRVQGLTTPHQGTLDPPEEVLVGSGAVVAAPLEVAVDCSPFRGAASPADGPSRVTALDGAPATDVLASVRSDAGAGAGTGAGAGSAVDAVDVRLPVLDSIARALDEQLGAACGGSPLLEPQTGWLWKDDGALRVTTTVPALGTPVQLVLEGSDGLGATADPPLPRSLGPGETAVVDLRVDPDCGVVGDGSLSWLDLRARDAQGGTLPLGRPTGSADPVSGVQPWLARQIALACG